MRVSRLLRLLCFAAPALALGLGCGAEAAPQGDTGAVATDASPLDVDVLFPDTAPVIVCPSVAVAPGAPTLGVDDDTFCFAALQAGSELEIVHGLQGGLHVQLRLALRAATPPKVSFSLEILQDGTRLARYAVTEPRSLSALADNADLFGTPSMPVVFASADATLYHGLVVEAVATVTIDGVERTAPPVTVRLVDPALASPR